MASITAQRAALTAEKVKWIEEIFNNADVEFFRKLLDRQGHLAIALIGFEGVLTGFAEQREVHFHHI